MTLVGKKARIYPTNTVFRIRVISLVLNVANLPEHLRIAMITMTMKISTALQISINIWDTKTSRISELASKYSCTIGESAGERYTVNLIAVNRSNTCAGRNKFPNSPMST